MRLGKLYKQAEKFEFIQKEVSTIINLSQVNKRELFKKARMSESNFYKRLNNRDFTELQIVQLFTALVEITNREQARH